MNATKFIGILLLCTLGVIGLGFYFVNNGDPVLGNKLVGFSTLFMFLILMPAFIVVRYKNKDLSKFNFNNKSKEEQEEEQDEDWDDKSRWN
ncbi:hypothetical protein [Nonlabens agnitus]|uniref:Isoleucyl-tRNA synthetase n=1 Tax=Nonlabens agnitus TaxID=870484 RepID=A0A2S9WWY7_9FLAO|nr:hypothetical protein [Nonlabens agnitus]PRP67951.1 hypothetical protein BST86_13045 [Nonlabens agnitus]